MSNSTLAATASTGSTTSYTSILYTPPAIPTDIHITPVPPLLSWTSDSMLMIFAPIVVYWIPSMLFHLIDTYDLFSKYRLHTPEELLKRNHVTVREVVKDVFLQQILQAVVGWLLSLSEGVEMTGHQQVAIIGMLHTYMKVESLFVSSLAVTGVNSWALVNKLDKAVSFDWRLKLVETIYWYAIPVVKIWIAVFFLDTWQYFWHRTMHTVPWLYRTFHSRHHRLYVPYAFGALYNHPFEGLLMDTFGAGIGFKLAGLTQRQGLYFFTFSTLKTIDDHCGYRIPWDPFQFLFANNATYHDIHHQGWGIKTNFSQPFFICWDRWLNTQWVGDVEARYARSRESAQKLVDKDNLQFGTEDNELRRTVSREVGRQAFPEDRYSDEESEDDKKSGSGVSQAASMGNSLNVAARQGLKEIIPSNAPDVKRRLIPDPLSTK